MKPVYLSQSDSMSTACRKSASITHLRWACLAAPWSHLLLTRNSDPCPVACTRGRDVEQEMAQHRLPESVSVAPACPAMYRKKRVNECSKRFSSKPYP
ncbi:hypothetical protein BJX99DRAFT_223612 [Aspergillus californicus]